ncbi:hypothetical protein BC835DRAFT_1409931 [Cytidiella melzeri]|nr:hypothetical protein BC835DRAFT_1409931 [Cytidiella melzeri]
MYEEKVLARGLQPSSSSSRIPIDIVIHPRDLNLLFIGYVGGVILLDITQRKTVKAYEFFLPPGALGGAGYHAQNANQSLQHSQSIHLVIYSSQGTLTAPLSLGD